MSRRIQKPANPSGEAGHGGTRPHYFATIDHYYNKKEIVPILEGQGRNIHFKKSKYGIHKLSQLEAAFSELWVLMVNEEGRQRTPRPYLAVKDETDQHSKIKGFASEQIKDWKSFKSHPQLKLWDKFNREDFAATSIVAGIFEEDDWHRDNIGTDSFTNNAALQNIDAVDNIHVMKIDHDMSFYHSIYSRLGVGKRATLHPRSKDRHHITPKDLTSFPVPSSKEFNPHYWPGIHRKGVHRNKRYTHADVHKVAEIAREEEYIKHKHFYLLKFIMMPKEWLQAAIAQHLEASSPLFDLVLNAVIERQAELKAVALATKQFRAKLNTYYAEYKEKLITQLTYYKNSISDNNLSLPLEKDFELLKAQSDLAAKDADKPLHAAIRSGSFRYDETLAKYKEALNKKNANEFTPMQLALAETDANGVAKPITAESKAIAKFLKDNGAKLPPGNAYQIYMAKPITNPTDYDRVSEWLLQNNRAAAFEAVRALNQADLIALIKTSLSHRQHSAVFNLIKTEWGNLENKPEGNFNDLMLNYLKNVLEGLRQNTQLTLKMKKNAAILAFKSIVPDLDKDQLGRAKEILMHEDYNFIRQLTSRLEIVRLWRGAYGVTSTYKTIANMILNRSTQLQRQADRDHKQEYREARRTIKHDFKDLHYFFGRHTRQYKNLTMVENLPAAAPAPAPAV